MLLTWFLITLLEQFCRLHNYFFFKLQDYNQKTIFSLFLVIKCPANFE